MLMYCEQQIHHKITEMNKGSLSAGTTYTSEMLESEGVYAQRLLNSTTNKQTRTNKSDKRAGQQHETHITVIFCRDVSWSTKK